MPSQANKNFIEEYAEAIESGKEIVGNWVKLAYRMILKRIQEGSLIYDHKKAMMAIAFIENFCHHHEGRNDLLKLELWQKAFYSCVFGLLDHEGNRNFREVFLVVGRKNGKTLMASATAEKFAFAEGEYGSRIYFIAPKLKQANLCFNAFYQSVKKEHSLNELSLKRRTDVYIAKTNTSAEPLAFKADTSDGFNPSLVVADEIGAWKGDQGLKQYEVLTSALGARKQPMILGITTSGYASESIYDELFARSTRILLGESKETRFLPLLYTIDDPEKWDDLNELKKSMPNLGVSVSEEFMRNEIKIASESLSKKTEFLVKYCNVKQSSSLAWLNAIDVEKCRGEHFGLEQFNRCYCVGGIDLSMTTDLTACGILIQKDGKFHWVCQFFLPRSKIEEASARDNLPYNLYIQRGLLKPSGENNVDYQDCYNWFVEVVEKYKLYPLLTGYDRYNALQLNQQMEAYGFHTTSVFQGENLTGVINNLEGLIKDGNLLIGDNDLMAVHLLNAALKINNVSERKRLIKLNKYSHVDGVAALLDALLAFQLASSDYGERLKNERRG